MKKIKKLLALVMAMTMVLGMAMTVSAAPGTMPGEGDSKTATVQNVEVGATVTAYQITVATYAGDNKDEGFTGYRRAANITDTMLADPNAPTSDEVTKLAKDSTLLNSLKKVTMDPNADADGDGYTSYTANLAPGYWLVLVTGTDIIEVYNPMLVGVYYSVSGTDGTMASDPVNANANWTLETANAYAKSTKPQVVKTITDEKDKNSVGIGDTVDFKIEADIPSYSDQYTEVEVVISDTLSEGLKLNSGSIAINIGGKAYIPGDTLVTGTDSFILTLPSDDVLTKYNGEKVEITYTATVEENIHYNFDPNTNTATLEYSNNPSNAEDTTTTDDKTYTYTFGIDALLYGNSETYTETTNEIIKVDEDGNVISTVTEISQTPPEGKTEVLTGATFKLTNNETNKEYTATTDVDGKLEFTGLDEGTYTLVETAAPSGFTVDTTEHTVEITAKYDAEGKLTSYTIKIDGDVTSTYTATYEGEEVKEINSAPTTKKIVNTKLASLPSTGGIGTTIFTIGGCVIMIAAAALFFVNRRKSEEN